MFDEYFGMTLKDRNYVSHTKKQLGGYSWFCPFRPINISTQKKKEAVRRFKFPSTILDNWIGENIIKKSLFVLERVLYQNENKGSLPSSITGFDLAIPVPSTSSRPVDICNIINGPPIIKGMIIKNKFSNIQIDQDLLDSEPNGSKVERQIKQTLHCLQKNHGDETYEAKRFPARYRRYLKNIFYISPNMEAAKLIQGGNILITEDSIGEFVTAREIIQLISLMEPRSILFFGCLRDYCSQDKYKNGSEPVNSRFDLFFTNLNRNI